MAGWIEIRATGPADAKDAASAALISAGSPGVLEETKAEASGRLVSFSRWEDETAEEADDSTVAALKAYLPEGAEKKLKDVSERLGRIDWSVATSFLKETDWSEKWKKGLRPVRVSRKGLTIVVKPTWNKSRRKPGEKIIGIDPGMAFGTGGHATTRMCLAAILWLSQDKKLPAAPHILDVGTGTGVLAIAAKKLGFKKAIGTDIDKVALKVARKNARLNRAQVTISGTPIESVKGRFAVVAANILAKELIKLSSPISGRVSPGGWLILSGILSHEKEKVAEAYSKEGMRLVKAYSSKEWTALVFLSPKDRP
ncbi:MAG: ribosomal protein L11 methyltransferase [Deltaproteobacteria bacterium GWC2_55_46]|nr:MAG: ribosomal protein L11 methyltransferase [Deltaproteobacteria bacterium GWA2_55_82]OGQ64749.1 MAG: ribosomal protein L11 methyltransferase [Deltaproteobacteria bacterium RIFCSPLOWO2_02_FULL_55_12]OIJ72594.1 MAG: ribosomal protein L11 methyltransferase [Deltaproteobacteria bacterium GWC2_55_46]HCY11938.1 50S ribosomal protein L11 methyltransferase [Deltaproteobacteria bacterium]